MPGPGMAARIDAAARNSGRYTPSMVSRPSVRPRQAERHHLLQRALHRRGWKQRQRIDGHRAIMLGAIYRVFQRAVLGHQPNGMVEIAVADLAALQRLDPEFALAVIAAA